MKYNSYMSVLLSQIGHRVRSRRKELGFSQAVLSSKAQVSSRFLAQLEAGKGNISIQRLADVCSALEFPLSKLFIGIGYQESQLIALVGLRGAGKSTVGSALAAKLNCDFVELDHLIVSRVGISLSEIFEMGGSEYYRELEYAALQALMKSKKTAVLATGGSIVNAQENWSILRQSAFTVWLQATPESHFARVQAQGDLRPMAGRPNAFSELRHLLSQREPLYALAELHINTDNEGIESAVDSILKSYQQERV